MAHAGWMREAAAVTWHALIGRSDVAAVSGHVRRGADASGCAVEEED